MAKNSVLVLFFFFIYNVTANIIPNENDSQWWKHATFYHIYPKSFKDSNGDGIGDLKGILEKLDYIQDLGINGIWFSPIFKSPQADNGYDISDYKDIDPQFGTMEDFLELIEKAHQKGLKVIMDFVPNHTSDQHPWFEKSVNQTRGYEDFYIWMDGKNGSRNDPPNNWINNFKHSAWTWNEKRQKFYFHSFLKEQPDLNYNSKAVREAMKDVLSFWLEEHDIDGARMDAVWTLAEADDFPDEPRSYRPDATEIDYDYLNHIYTAHQPKTFEIISEWMEHINDINKRTGKTKISIGEVVGDIKTIVRYHGDKDGSQLGVNFAFNFEFIHLNRTSTTKDLAHIIELWMQEYPKLQSLNWVLGNHDTHRVATRVGVERVDIMNMLTAFLPGIQVTYSGEEIGMEDGEVSCEQGKDLVANCTAYAANSRDFERTPMQWDSSEYGGFTNGSTPWLPVSSKRKVCNVKDQYNNATSHLNIFKQLQTLRPLLRNQSHQQIHFHGENEEVMEIVRYNIRNGEVVDLYKLVFNYGERSVKNVNVSKGIYWFMDLMVHSGNLSRKEIIDGTSLYLEPYEAMILRPSKVLP